jgi:hypothetical protein
MRQAEENVAPQGRTGPALRIGMGEPADAFFHDQLAPLSCGSRAR